MTDLAEWIRDLRTLAREFDDPAVFMPIVRLAERYEREFQQRELEQIIQAQRDWAESN